MSENKPVDTKTFKAELEALCEKYGITLTATNYGLIQVYRRDLIDDGPIAYWAYDWDQTSD